MVWVVGAILFLFFGTRGLVPGPELILFRFGKAVEVDWRDIIALLITGVVVYLLVTDRMVEESALVVLTSMLVGKTISR